MFGGLREDAVLAVKPAERRQASERQRAHHEGPERDRHLLAQPAHLPDVLLVVDRNDDGAGAQEQQRLEERMGRQMEHRRRRAVEANGHHHVAELRERRIGQDALDVVLLDGDDGGQQGGEPANPRDDLQRMGAGDIEQEEHAAKHVHARGDHRRGMNQGADGRGAFHGVGQPDVQRKLRALAHRAAEDQQAGGRRQRAQGLRVGGQGLLDHVELQGAEGRPDRQDAEQEPEVPQTIGDEGFLACVRRRRSFKPETDEQVAGHADQFPEDEELKEVVGQHDAEHREGEQAQAGEIAREPAVLAHVAPGVDVNRAGDAGHDEHHQQAQRVKPQPEVRLQIADRQPGDERLTRRAPAIQLYENQAQNEPGHHGPDGKAGAELAVVLREQRDERRRQQREEQDCPG